MFPLIPVLTLSAYWFSNKVKHHLLRIDVKRRYISLLTVGGGLFIFLTVYLFYRLTMKPFGPNTLVSVSLVYIIIILVVLFGLSCKYFLQEMTQKLLIKRFTILVFLLLFSRGLFDWVGLSQINAKDIYAGDVKILEDRPYSMKRSFNDLDSLVQGCRGILTLESTFVGAFMSTPVEKVYDVWEIPPFGNLNDSEYKGLKPDRIDCLLISNNLATNTGAATNHQLRYENYINPYAEQLIKMGAKVYKLPYYGKVIIFESTK